MPPGAATIGTGRAQTMQRPATKRNSNSAGIGGTIPLITLTPALRLWGIDKKVFCRRQIVRSWLLELLRQGGDRGVEHRRAASFVEPGDDHLPCRGDRDLDRDRTDFGDRLCLRLGDPLLGHL